METQTVAVVMAGGGALGVLVWVLAKLGKALITIAEALAALPRVLGVRSGASWDEVRVRLVPGQKPEDFDEATRALACARGVTRCQVRELTPNVVSIDFQRRWPGWVGTAHAPP